MKRMSKRMKRIYENIDIKNNYNIIKGLSLLKKTSSSKFVESVDVSIHLGIDSKQSNQNVKGAVTYPCGLGKSSIVVVFTQEINSQLAKESGADFVGMEDLAEKIKNKKIKPDVVIASPDAMNIVGKLGSFLGPRGLMPNLKLGTVTDNIKNAVINAKKGQFYYKNDKNGIIHAAIGNVSFTENNLQENLLTLLFALKKSKPAHSKGQFIQKISLSTTMGPSIVVDKSSLNISLV